MTPAMLTGSRTPAMVATMTVNLHSRDGMRATIATGPRNARLWATRRAGKTFEAIAKLEGITRQRAHRLYMVAEEAIASWPRLNAWHRTMPEWIGNALAYFEVGSPGELAAVILKPGWRSGLDGWQHFVIRLASPECAELLAEAGRGIKPAERGRLVRLALHKAAGALGETTLAMLALSAAAGPPRAIASIRAAAHSLAAAHLDGESDP